MSVAAGDCRRGHWLWGPTESFHVPTRRTIVGDDQLTTDHGQLTTDDLTDAQAAAVAHREGPLLVLAGPGSGKTRVVTSRIARLVEDGVDPREILAITFTNKAAREMQERVGQLIPETRVWISTFHRFCAWMLRKNAQGVGLDEHYTIADTTDQRQVIRRVLNDLEIDATGFPPSRINAAISNAKNDLIRAEDYAERFEERVGTHEQAIVARVYPAYQKALLAANSVDFDDLLLHVVDLFRENEELRARWDERFRYVLVDEYQDTNMAQYEIVRALSLDVPNVQVTGDPDQSIYGWRGARIDNILRFEQDYEDATVIKLQENFRSTKSVLGAADALIVHNRQRKAKKLVTANETGRPVELLHFRDGRHEADLIASDIRRRVDDDGERRWSDYALCYRMNSLSRELEVALRRHGVPFQVAAGVSFFERAEVKDVVAYLKLVLNPADRIAFERVVNTPPRGIGKTSRDRLLDWATLRGLNPLEAAARADEVPGVSKRSASALKRFAAWYDGFDLAAAGSMENLLRTILETTGYAAPWIGKDDEEALQRLSNVDELLSVAARYDDEVPDEQSLEEFLESVSLANEVDNLDEDAGVVTLMTLHAAKGLEFPVVYLVGVEQNLLPHERSLKELDRNGLEEERRLLFVGMTRAREELYLTQTTRREMRGRPLHTIPSEFLREMAGQFTLRDMTREAPPDDEPEPTFRRSPRRATPRRPPDQPLLTTGAALLEGRTDAAPLPLGFSVGMQVRHPRYGRGTIETVGGFSKNRTVTVRFDEDDRTETFVVSKSPLQPIGGQ